MALEALLGVVVVAVEELMVLVLVAQLAPLEEVSSAIYIFQSQTCLSLLQLLLLTGSILFVSRDPDGNEI